MLINIRRDMANCLLNRIQIFDYSLPNKLIAGSFKCVWLFDIFFRELATFDEWTEQSKAKQSYSLLIEDICWTIRNRR